MDSEDSVKPFVAGAKERGASDETVLLLLRDKGWPERLARKQLAAYYEQSIGIEAPSRHDPGASNPLDGFLYVFATGTLVSWVTAAVMLGSGFIDDAFPEKAASPSPQTYWEIGQTAGALATLLVTGPIYLALMFVLQRRLRLGATAWFSPVRLWVLSFTLLIGVATILGYLVATVAELIGGEPATASILKSLYALTILGALTAYYLGWLRAKGRKDGT